jgi:hypothetical protein
MGSGGDLVVGFADNFGGVLAVQGTDGEVAFGEALEVVGEEDVEGRASGGSFDGEELGGGFLSDFQAEAGGDAG